MIILKIIGIILLILLFLIAILLFINLKFLVLYDKEVSLYLQVLFIKIPLLPKKTKKPIERKKVEKKVEKEGKKGEDYVKKLINKYGFVDTLEILKRILKPTFKTLEKFLNKCSIYNFNFQLQIAGKEPAELAVEYGRFCALFYPAVSGVTNLIPTKKIDTNVFVDYTKQNYLLFFDFRLKFKLIHFLLIGVNGFKIFIYLKRKLENPERNFENEREN